MAKEGSLNLNPLYHNFSPSLTRGIQKELERIIKHSKTSAKLPPMLLKETMRSNTLSETKFQKNFVPFLYERDNIGRLLTSESTFRKTKDRNLLDNYQEETDSCKNRKMRLVLPNRDSIGPIFAQYYSPTSWIKKSFSTNRIKKVKKKGKVSNSPELEGKNINISPLQKQSAKAVKKYKRQLTDLLRNVPEKKEDAKDLQRSKFDILKPEVLAKIRAKNSFGSMKIHGTPSEIEEVLKFNYIRDREKEITSELKAISSSLQRYRLSN
ncbi:unnamed protein product [Blepharisma stoltei]|uniref:Uncharacterized protein n=1 Tax=Blepharisma stoltei TaxID=1481888 RepID=A0AAU9J7C2_9CILI|nr:unnamed protein product [Blepharisma stoltei]